eukprot:EG_transcript_18838
MWLRGGFSSIELAQSVAHLARLRQQLHVATMGFTAPARGTGWAAAAVPAVRQPVRPSDRSPGGPSAAPQWGEAVSRPSPGTDPPTQPTDGAPSAGGGPERWGGAGARPPGQSWLRLESPLHRARSFAGFRGRRPEGAQCAGGLSPQGGGGLDTNATVDSDELSALRRCFSVGAAMKAPPASRPRLFVNFSLPVSPVGSPGGEPGGGRGCAPAPAGAGGPRPGEPFCCAPVEEGEGAEGALPGPKVRRQWLPGGRPRGLDNDSAPLSGKSSRQLRDPPAPGHYESNEALSDLSSLQLEPCGPIQLHRTHSILHEAQRAAESPPPPLPWGLAAAHLR